jgi:hypothetical protein
MRYLAYHFCLHADWTRYLTSGTSKIMFYLLDICWKVWLSPEAQHDKIFMKEQVIHCLSCSLQWLHKNWITVRKTEEVYSFSNHGENLQKFLWWTVKLLKKSRFPFIYTCSTINFWNLHSVFTAFNSVIHPATERSETHECREQISETLTPDANYLTSWC